MLTNILILLALYTKYKFNVSKNVIAIEMETNQWFPGVKMEYGGKRVDVIIEEQ